MTTKPAGPVAAPKRQMVVQQGAVTLSFDGTLPVAITPARDGSVTFTQGAVHSTLPTSAQMSVGFKGAWPQDPPPPPPGNLVPPVDPTGLPVIAKPAKGVSWTTPVYGTTEARVTDHASEIPGSQFFRNDYSRRQPFNCSDTMFVGYVGGGSWHVYSVPSWTYLKTISANGGPGGDAEVQWDPTNPDLLYYMDTNGGTVIRTLLASSLTHGVAYDFRTDVANALGTNDFDHCWTKSEGSPSADGKLWGLICQKYNQSTGDFDTRGYVVLDIVARRVVWSKVTTAGDRPDHVSMSPCGRWFTISGGSDPTTRAIGIAPDVLNQVRPLHHDSEHSDLGLLANGHSFYISVDYQTSDGDAFWIDLEDPTATRHVIDRMYHDPANPNVYSIHLSAKAYRKPGWVVESREGDNAHPCNVMLLDLNTGRRYGVGLNYPVVSNYWDEPQSCPNRTLTMIASNQTFGTSQNVDVCVVHIP